MGIVFHTGTYWRQPFRKGLYQHHLPPERGINTHELTRGKDYFHLAPEGIGMFYGSVERVV